MGFYLELSASPEGGEYREREIPPVFWGLLTFAGLALAGMAGAAFSLLRDLAMGGWVDRIIVFGIALFVPAFLVLCAKLLWVRKYIRFRGATLETGFSFGPSRCFKSEIKVSDIKAIELLNERRAQNLATRQHDDQQYYIRGHWRIVVTTKAGRAQVLDRHTEKGAVEGLFQDLNKWWNSSVRA